MQSQPTVPTLPSRPAPRRATTRRYTLTLRRRLPNEAWLIEDLRARTSGRRAQRIRALLLLGLDRDAPSNDLGKRGTEQAETETLRITVLIHEIDPEDAVLRDAFAQIGPLNRQEWLRDRLAAGLCGVDVPFDVGQVHSVQTPPLRSCAPDMQVPLDVGQVHGFQSPPQRSRPPDTPALGRSTTPAPPVAQVSTDDAEEIPSAVTVEHDPGPSQAPDAIAEADGHRVDVGEDGTRKLPGLNGLFV